MANDTKQVKNVSGVLQEVVGYGHVEADGVIDVAADFHNANFEDVKSAAKPTPKKNDTATQTD